jgi:hypothetical protein
LTEEKIPSLDSVKKKTIEAKFASTGFETEEQVALTLLEDNWNAMRNPRYYLKNEDRFKEMDIIARKSLKKDSNLRFLLVIECKKQEKWPWVFLQVQLESKNALSVSFPVKETSYGNVYSKT